MLTKFNPAATNHTSQKAKRGPPPPPPPPTPFLLFVMFCWLLLGWIWLTLANWLCCNRAYKPIGLRRPGLSKQKNKKRPRTATRQGGLKWLSGGVFHLKSDDFCDFWKKSTFWHQKTYFGAKLGAEKTDVWHRTQKSYFCPLPWTKNHIFGKQNIKKCCNYNGAQLML